MPTLDDIDHWWGDDLSAAPNGDMLRVNGPARSMQRVYRRLLTNPGEYGSHPTYGAGLRAMVGQIANVAELTALIRGQMLREPSVAASPAPTVSLQLDSSGALAEVAIRYVALPDQQPVALTFPLLGTP